MSGEGSPQGAIETAEAVVADAAAQSAETAQEAAAATIALAGAAAATAEVAAAERTAETERRVADTLNNQGDALAGFMQRVETWQSENLSRLTAAESRAETAERMAAENQTALRELVERLTPPPPLVEEPAQPVTEQPPAERQESGEGAARQEAAKPRRAHRLL